MQEANNLNKTAWFVNPWFDIILLAGFPLASIIPWLFYFYMRIPHFEYHMYSVLNFPHILSGLAVVYLSQMEHKKRPIIFLVIPAIIFIATIIFYTAKYSFLFRIIRTYWGHWHIFIQFYYILRLSRLRAQNYLRNDKILDTLVTIIGFFSLMLYYSYVYQHQINLAIDITKIPYSISISKHLLKYPVIFTYFITTVFILRQSYLFIRWRKIYLSQILMVFMFILIYYIPLMIFKNLFLATYSVITLHSVQYIAWVWFYHRQKFKDEIVKGARFISYLSSSGHALSYFLCLYLISIAFLFILMRTVSFEKYAAVMYAFLFIHFFLDGLTWKISKVHNIVNK